MLDFHEKRKLKSWVYSKPTAAIIFALGLLLFVSVVGRFEAEREVAQKRAERARELAELNQRAATLEAEVERLKSVRGIETEIRDRFEVAKEGEQVIVIVEDPLSASEKTETTRKSPPNTSVFDWLIFW